MFEAHIHLKPKYARYPEPNEHSEWKNRHYEKPRSKTSFAGKTPRIYCKSSYHLDRSISSYQTQNMWRIGRPFGIVNTIRTIQCETNHLVCDRQNFDLLSVRKQKVLTIWRIAARLPWICILGRIYHNRVTCSTLFLFHSTFWWVSNKQTQWIKNTVIIQINYFGY